MDKKPRKFALKGCGMCVTGKGKPDQRVKDSVSTRVMDFNDGLRVRHWVDQNSVKVYNEQNVLRVELTMNNPSKFKVHRHKQGQPTSEPKSRLPLRKALPTLACALKCLRKPMSVLCKTWQRFKTRPLFINCWKT